MPMVDVLGARRFQEVMDDTWGHLRVQPGIRYPVTLVAVCTAYGEYHVLSIDTEVPDSPWFFEAQMDWLDTLDLKGGDIIRLVGKYRLDREQRLSGRIEHLSLKEAA